MFVNVAHIDDCMCRGYLYSPTGILETLILVLKKCTVLHVLLL